MADKTSKTEYVDQVGTRQKLDPNDPETQRRVAAGELREAGQADQSNQPQR